MSEENPSNPNEVKQPQETETGHIEVAYHDDNQQPSNESGESQLATENDETTRLDSPNLNDSTQTGTSDEQIGPDYIKDKDKAEVMAHAQNDAYTENEINNGRYTNPEYVAEQAEMNYDLSVAIDKERVSHVTTPEEAREYALVNKGIFLKYSKAIAENYEKHGDKLRPNLAALKLVQKLVKDVGYNNFSIIGNNFDQINIELDESYGGAILVTPTFSSRGSKEQWRLPMFGKGEYRLSQVTGDPEHKFSRVEITKTRSLSDEDVANLDELLKPAIQYRKQMDKRQQEANYDDEDDGVLRPGDEGYEDALREEHYGRDGTNGNSYLEENYGIKP